MTTAELAAPAGDSSGAVTVRPVATPEEIAAAVVYLASPAAEWASGAVLDLNGGPTCAKRGMLRLESWTISLILPGLGFRFNWAGRREGYVDLLDVRAKSLLLLVMNRCAAHGHGGGQVDRVRAQVVPSARTVGVRPWPGPPGAGRAGREVLRVLTTSPRHPERLGQDLGTSSTEPMPTRAVGFRLPFPGAEREQRGNPPSKRMTGSRRVDEDIASKASSRLLPRVAVRAYRGESVLPRTAGEATSTGNSLWTPFQAACAVVASASTSSARERLHMMSAGRSPRRLPVPGDRDLLALGHPVEHLG